MNLEMIMTSIIGSTICIFFAVYSGQIIMEEKIDKKKNLFYMISYIVFLTLNFYMKDKVLKTFSACVIMIIFYKLCFDKSWIKSTVGSLILYLMILASELVYGILISLIFELLNINMLSILNNTIIVNASIAILVIFFTNIFKKIIKIVMRNTNKYEEKNIPILFTTLLISFTMIVNHVNIKSWTYGLDLYINIILFISLTIIFIFAITQKYQNNKVAGNYKKLQDYSKLTDEVLEEYRVKNHEYKNQLAIIKSFVTPDNKELEEYVNNLIEKNKKAKYEWINQVKYIPLPGLKGLLNYKITEFNSININTSIIVSKDIEKCNFDNLTIKEKDDLYTIVGVYLDNAKEAAIESEKPVINIDVSLNDKNVIITISNTYKGKIELDKIDNYRYSTKGKDRGVGLYIVKRIINNTKILSVERVISEKYFIQKLYIKVEDKNNID